MSLIVVALLGLLTGSLIRRFTPALLSMSDRSMPYRFPWVEALGLLTFVWVELVLGHQLSQLKWYLFCLLLLAVTSTDFLAKYIPDKLCYLGTVLGVLVTIVFPTDTLSFLNQGALLEQLGVPFHNVRLAGGLISLSGAAVGFVLMEFIRRVFRTLIHMEAMGMGDSILMMMIGSFLGPQMTLYALLPSCLLGVAMGLLWQAFFKTPHFPFGPSLAYGSILMLLHGPYLLNRMGAFYSLLYDMPPTLLLGLSIFLIGLLFFMVLRLKRKAAFYQKSIDEDYEEIDKKMNKS